MILNRIQAINMEDTNNNPIVNREAKGIDFNFKPNEDSKPSARSLRNLNEFITFEVDIVVPYTDAADSNYYPTFYVAEVQSFLIEAKMKHAVAGGASAAVTVARVPSGSAKSAGQSMLLSYFDLTAVANTVQSRVASITLAGIQLQPGDSMALKTSGTLTGAQDVCVTVLLGVLARDLPTGSNV